jgi:hypothetical protein
MQFSFNAGKENTFDIEANINTRGVSVLVAVLGCCASVSIRLRWLGVHLETYSTPGSGPSGLANLGPLEVVWDVPAWATFTSRAAR